LAEYTSAKAGLFYPHIHFRSREWLRSSILYYDKLSRIVPRGVLVDRVHWYGEFMTHSQAEEIVRDVDALKASGFLNDESPEAILGEVSQEFSAFLETALSNPERSGEASSSIVGRQELLRNSPGQDPRYPSGPVRSLCRTA
jgi:hypothetical protein